MYIFDSEPLLVNCMFRGNFAIEEGGGLYGSPTVINSTFIQNSAIDYWFKAFGDGGGIKGEPSITNCILWNNEDSYHGMSEGAQISGPFSEVNYSCIQNWTGSLGGVGNFGLDPLLADEDGRLSPGSPCIDAADNDAVPADEFDLDGDGDTTEPVPHDLDGNPRFVDDPATEDSGNPGVPGPPVVDMGAYEFQVEEELCEGDANGDGNVDPLDSGFVLARFGCPVGTGDPDCDVADQNGDGVVDPLDSGFVLARFGECP